MFSASGREASLSQAGVDVLKLVMAWMPCHGFSVSLLSLKWPWIFLACARFASLMARDSLALAVLRASLSPALKAVSRALSSARTSAVIHGLLLGMCGDELSDSNVINVLTDVTSH